MKKWIAILDIELTLTEGQIMENLEYFGSTPFADPKNPSIKEIKEFFQDRLYHLAGSNDGSELLANADFRLVQIDV